MYFYVTAERCASVCSLPLASRLGPAMANDPMNTGHPMDYGMHSSHDRTGKDPTPALRPRAALASAVDPPRSAHSDRRP